MHINVNAAKLRRILVNPRDIFKLKSLLTDCSDGFQVHTFDLGVKRSLSYVDAVGLAGVMWAKLNGRKEVCPIINGKIYPKKKPKTSKMTLVFVKKKSYVRVISAYYGDLTPRFPDSYADGSAERQTAIAFWKKNVLIVGPNDTIELVPKPEWAKGMMMNGMRGNMPFFF